MSYESVVYRILIASPSDVDEEREISARIIQDWNDLNSFSKKIVLLPVRWETHSSPTFGVRPQDAINKQVVDECDLLIGFFWTKIGTPTGEELSGTIEEIKRVSKAGKPVMLYFSKRGKDPSLIDLVQLESLNKFKEEVYTSALVEHFSSLVDFRDKLSRHLEMKIRELQERKDDNKDIITFSFIDKDTGELINGKTVVDIERIDIDDKRIKQIMSEDSRIAKKKWKFNSVLVNTLNKKNNIPVILGLRNNVNRVFGNVNIELKLKSSVEDSLNIHSLSSSDDSNLTYRLDEFIPEENKSNIQKLFGGNYVQTSLKSWEFKFNPFTILPNKIKVIDSLILLFPRDSMTLEFNIRLFSDNILQTIESSCELTINFKKREITEDEITEIIENLPEDDDLPF